MLIQMILAAWRRFGAMLVCPAMIMDPCGFSNESCLVMCSSVERLEAEVEALDRRATEAETAEAELLQELRQIEAIAADRYGFHPHVRLHMTIVSTRWRLAMS